ncbi:MAG: hypothetical protein HGA76_12285, partial [Candidatus Firestonebacteria bacterium]|nr:hypothetical protein [Candidatus Firestonebacteria bacterium]
MNKHSQFTDRAGVKVMAGRGGNGSSHFRREKWVPLGGPDGGDGGRGGHVIFRADPNLNTLVDFRFQRIHRAESGHKGMGKDMRGRGGRDLLVRVPVGTRVFDQETSELVGELLTNGQRLELDRRLAEKMRKSGIEVIQGDALQVELPDFDICVSNLPYQISSGITMRLLDKGFKKAVL